MKFAVFVMTYNRPEILGKTIVSLLGQTLQPEKILVIDNDPSKSAKSVVEKLVSLPIEYYSTGSNIGPAGAAKKGLEILTQEGFDWIGWMDDDDPPVFSDSFEKLLTIAQAQDNCGCVGAVGHFFNINNGLIKRVTDQQLDGAGFVSVDNIAGGMCKIVNGKAIRQNNILPNDKLFYGFEELDFDLRLKKAGYFLLADKDLYRRSRINFNRVGLKIKRGHKKETSRLWREYYSTRNLLFILRHHKFNKAVFYTIARSVLKCLTGFRFGFTYGFVNAKFLLLGILHFLKGKTGSLKSN